MILEGVAGNRVSFRIPVDYHRLNDDYTISPTRSESHHSGAEPSPYSGSSGLCQPVSADLAKATYLPGTVTPLAPGTSSTYSTSLATWGNSVFTDSRQRTTDFKEQVVWVKGKAGL